MTFRNLAGWLIAVLLLLPAAAGAVRPAMLAPSQEKAREAWVDSVMLTLDLRHRIGQLFIPMLDPRSLPAAKMS